MKKASSFYALIRYSLTEVLLFFYFTIPTVFAKSQKNERKAAQLFRKSADQGHAMAQVNLGTAYIFGRGVQKNAKTVAKWYRKPAEQDNIDGIIQSLRSATITEKAFRRTTRKRTNCSARLLVWITQRDTRARASC